MIDVCAHRGNTVEHRPCGNWQRVCEMIPAEDFAVAEEIQGNINDGVVSSLQIGANESLIFDHRPQSTA